MICAFSNHPPPPQTVLGVTSQKRLRSLTKSVNFNFVQREGGGQNIICSLTQLDAMAHEQTIIWRQSFTGNVVGSRPIKRKKNLHRMIIRFMQNLARELSVGVTDCITMGDWKTKNWELQNFHGLKKKWRFSTQVQKNKLGICLFAGSLGELQQVSTSLP